MNISEYISNLNNNDSILLEVNEILKNEAHYIAFLDEDNGESDKLIANECCLMTKGYFHFLGFEGKNYQRDSYDIFITIKHEDQIYNKSFVNHGRNINLLELSIALNEMLAMTNYTGEKYFCDVSLDGDAMAVIAFIEFPIEKKMVETADLFRGYSEEEPFGYGYYYEKMRAFNNK